MKMLNHARRDVYGLLATAAVCVAAIAPASAQKAKDTLRIAVSAQIPTLSQYEFAQQDASFVYRSVYDPLFSYDEQTKKYLPRLAKSWKMIDSTTIEFELRDDIVFHNGSKMDADDVVYLANWTVDPLSRNIQRQNRFTGTYKRAEKMGPYTVRFTLLENSPLSMLRLNAFYPLDSEVHKSLADKSEYGRKPIGTGPMQVSEFQAGQKIVLTRFKDYKFDVNQPIGRIETVTIPDQQTQIAQLLTGGIDLMREPSKDQIEEIGSRPGVSSSVAPGGNILYVMIDSINRSGDAKPLLDVRVRRAIAMGLDRAALIENLGFKGQDPKPLEAMCVNIVPACAYTVAAPAFDLAGAKKLLAEAGYPNGFPIEVTTRPLTKQWGEAIGGELYKIGIQAKINNVPETVFRKITSEGKIQIRVHSAAILTLPDAHLAFQSNFEEGGDDYAQDETIKKLGDRGLTTIDPVAREKVYSDLFDRINSQVYLIPVTLVPQTYLHSSDVAFSQTPGYVYSPMLSDFRWK